MNFTLKITKHYGKAIRTKSPKGFCLNLPLCEFVSISGNDAIVDKEFYLSKKLQAEQDAIHWKNKQAIPSNIKTPAGGDVMRDLKGSDSSSEQGIKQVSSFKQTYPSTKEQIAKRERMNAIIQNLKRDIAMNTIAKKSVINKSLIEAQIKRDQTRLKELVATIKN